ncbi:hypothetical protein CDL12_15884 [Handroanthus impetiginosus]|uniref:GATA-4/5/6 transcription factor n=1 Tax=Handroanthus impetiginosus TaxID=429701 RepID=A0A2G9H1Y5_9LAMI|nr:hypothetical protein CDL12_15884 [Handroanthus impetiginosus]
MGYLCDFCGEQRAIIYCRSDVASLCLSCDCNVHSANALSKRHMRTLVCERCNSQPAFVRCIEEKISLCQNCDWTGHVGSNISPQHKRQGVNCYTGCPSAAELSAIWPFLLEQEMSSMSIADRRSTDCQAPQGKSNVQDALRIELASDCQNLDVDRSSVWMESLTPLIDQNVDPTPGATSPAMPKFSVSGAKGPSLCENDNFYGDFNMDEVDISIENYEELFGVALDNPEQLFGNDGIDGIFGTKDVSNLQGGYANEALSIGGLNVMQSACSNAASADSVMSCKTDPNLCFARQAPSGLSFSGLTGESSVGDYQDCGASSIPIVGEPPWYPPGPESSMPSTSRSDAVMRYKEKKKSRKFEKKVRYESRKARADIRKRVKGRFVKAGDAYDYDPLSPSRSF